MTSIISIVLLYSNSNSAFNFSHENPKLYNVRQNVSIKQEIPEIYKKRQKHIKDKCEEHHDEIVANYKSYSPLQSFENVVTKADVLYNTNNVPFLWCKIPKVASQSWSDLFVHTW